MKRKFKKIEKDIAFTSGKNLQQSLCQKNKPKLLPNSQPVVYQLDCLCNGKYIGESKKKVLTRFIEHEWKMRTVWGYRTQKTIRLVASKNSTY